MIKLNRNFTPLCLSPPERQRLTKEYIASGRPVWNFSELKTALLQTSHGKCAYCECRLSVESKYAEVEHFRDKTRNPNLVMEWTNLVPACKRCNVAKGSHDTGAIPILNPYSEDPREHLSLRWYRLRAETGLGESTVAVLNLNDTTQLVQVRFEIGEAIQASLAVALERLDAYVTDPSTRRRNALVSHVRGLINECCPPAEYAATAATVLRNEEDYERLQAGMLEAEVWTDELQNLHQQMSDCVLPTT